MSKGDIYGLVPVEVSQEILEGVRAESVAMRLMRRLPNMSTSTREQPVLSMLPMADFVSSDAGLAVDSRAGWEKKNLVAGEITAIVPVPRAVIEDASYDIWGEVKPLLMEQFGRVFDRAVLYERNAKAPAEWPNPIIPAAIAAGNCLTLGTEVDIAEDINKLYGLLEDNEYDVTALAALKSLKTQLRGLRDANKNFLYAEPGAEAPGNIYGVPTHFVGRGTWDAEDALAIAGEWNMGMYSIRQDMTFDIFSDGVVSDEDGKIVYNLMQQDMVALRAVLRLGWILADPAHIGRSEGAYPFAVLKG